MSWVSRTLHVATCALPLLTGGCANMFRDFPDKGHDSYRIDAARVALDSYSFDTAISNIAPVLARNPKNEDVAYIAAAAYAGRAGLRVLDLFTNIASKIGEKGILAIFAEYFVGTTASQVTDIETAVTILETYGARATDRSSDMNFFALFLYYSRIGVYLNFYAYDPTAGTLLKAPGATVFKACQISSTPTAATTGLPDTAVDKIMTTIPRIIETAATVAGGGSSFDALKSVNATVERYIPGGLPFDPIPCSANSNAAACLGVRTLVAASKAEGGFGVGTGEGACPTTTP